MKRSIKKIEKQINKSKDVLKARNFLKLCIGFLLIIGFSSCQKAWHGSDGRPGNAFIALQWNETEPSYIDAGTAAIPRIFYWDEFYKINPGVYQLYYEGSTWAGNGWANYSWEVSYEIWELEGERGDWYYNGEDGPDNYFTIECNPYGPYVSNIYKEASANSKLDILEKSDDTIILLQKAEGVQMKVTYTKVAARDHSSIKEI